MSYDVIVRGGRVVDGSGAEPVRADVGIRGDRVVTVGDLGAATGVSVLDATDMLVFPGFVDAHSHADVLLGEPRVQEAYLRQGVTTVILGQDGVSFAPGGAAGVDYADRYFRAVNGPAPAAYRAGVSVAEFLGAHDGAGPLNVAYLVPAATVRAEVVGLAPGRASAAELAAMADLVRHGMADGAVGLSTGLDYVPGQFADTAELIALGGPVGDAGGVYVSHMRGYAADRTVDAIGEVARITAGSGARGHVSHLHGPADLVSQALDAARDLSFDSYPYLRGNTILAMPALPSAVQSTGTAATLTLLGDPDVRDRLRHRWFPTIDGKLRSITVSYAADPQWRWLEGRSLVGAAAQWPHGDLTDLVCTALVDCELAVGCVLDNGPDRTEEDLRRLLGRAEQMAGSDAIFLGSAPHPRGWGTFARFLGRHVRELGDWTWGAAAWHLAGHAAARFGLAGRGTVRQDAVADLVVLDPAVVTDRSSYPEPTVPADGVRHVLVGGRPALADGVLRGGARGRAIRRT